MPAPCLRHRPIAPTTNSTPAPIISGMRYCASVPASCVCQRGFDFASSLAFGFSSLALSSFAAMSVLLDGLPTCRRRLSDARLPNIDFAFEVDSQAIGNLPLHEINEPQHIA